MIILAFPLIFNSPFFEEQQALMEIIIVFTAIYVAIRLIIKLVRKINIERRMYQCGVSTIVDDLYRMNHEIEYLKRSKIVSIFGEGTVDDYNYLFVRMITEANRKFMEIVKILPEFVDNNRSPLEEHVLFLKMICNYYYKKP